MKLFEKLNEYGYEQLVGVLGLPSHTEAGMQNGDIWLAFYELREGGKGYL